MDTQRPKIGVAVLVFKDGMVLFGKRKTKNGLGTWAPPGGHLEWGEELEVCAEREVLEETGIKIKNVRRGPYTNDIYPDGEHHYISIFMLADYASGEVANLEPEKCEGWEWFDWDHIPGPNLPSVGNLRKQGFRPPQ